MSFIFEKTYVTYKNVLFYIIGGYMCGMNYLRHEFCVWKHIQMIKWRKICKKISFLKHENSHLQSSKG